ncbi:MAG: hypothetical protein ACRC8M_00405 [Cetobacterium sp.]
MKKRTSFDSSWKNIANMILFFASEKASWITGQVIKVSGGHAL